MQHRWVYWGALVGVLAGCDQQNDGGADPFRPVVTAGTGSIDPFPVGGFGGSGHCSVPGSAGSPSLGFPGSGGTGQVSPHFFTATQNAAEPPPAISGGTLLATADGQQLIAADPDRDAIYVVDVATRTLTRKIELSPKDEPGRLVQDKAGRVHVALRGGKSIASFDPKLATSDVRRSQVCDLPRGLGYDSASDHLYVACAEGSVVRVDPNEGKALHTLNLGRDVRDVTVRGSKLFVTRFRAAELLEIDATDGRVMNVRRPPASSETEFVTVQDSVDLPDGVCGFAPPRTEERQKKSTPTVAWRAMDVPGRGMAMLHQRSSEGEVRVTTPGGYGGGPTAMGCTPGIVRGAITVGDDASLSVDLGVPGLFVDLAVDATGSLMAVANPAGWGVGASVAVFEMPTRDVVGAQAGPMNNPTCYIPNSTFQTDGQPTAVSFVTPWLLAVQEREPAGITFYDVRTPNSGKRLDLAQPSRFDSGHTLFHLATGSGLACASCHAEAGDDAHVWTFEGIGARRTQNIRGGILGSEPFHWNGDMHDFRMLVNEVFVGRMAAPEMRRDQADALASWIDRQPVLTASVRDSAAVERGEALFKSEAVGCATCHTGARLSNNEAADVGTGAFLQVPSLRAVSFRAPLMHDGCAVSVADRFTSCGGGDKHGKTSHLQPAELSDLVTYLESL